MAVKSESHTGRNIAIGCGLAVILIPIIIVVGSIFFAGVLTALNPAQKLAQANDTMRRNNLMQISNVIREYQTDNQGKLPMGITETPQEIAKNGADICALLVPTYRDSLPTDPSLATSPVTDCSSSYTTGYQVSMNPTTGAITLSAPNAVTGSIQVVK